MKISDKIRTSQIDIKISQKSNISYDLYLCLNELEQRKNDRHFLINIPVMIVSANESFFKEMFASILDFDEKYLENSKKILQKIGVKIDITDIFHITKSSFTLGTLVSYYLKYSSIENILSVFKEITDFDLLIEIDSIKDELDEYESPVLTSPERPFLKSRIISNLKEIYEVRNVICHDFLSATHKLSLDASKMEEYLTDAILLQEASIILCSDKIYSKKIPLDDDLSLKYYNQILDEKLKELNQIYKEIESSLSSEYEIRKLKENIEIFNTYLKNDSQNFGRFWFRKPESDFPFEDLEVQYKIKIIDQRILNIKREIYQKE